MKAFTVLIPTTQNVVGFADITEENKNVSPIVCINNNLTPLAISSDYNNFVKSPSGVVEKFTNISSYRLDLTDNIDTGESWQLGFFVAHLINHLKKLIFSEADNLITSNTDSILWCTGTINVNLDLKDVRHINTKLKKSISIFEEAFKQNKKVYLCVSKGNSKEVENFFKDKDYNFIENIKIIPLVNVRELLKFINYPVKFSNNLGAIKRLSLKTIFTMMVIGIIVPLGFFLFQTSNIFFHLKKLKNNDEHIQLMRNIESLRQSNFTSKFSLFLFDYFQSRNNYSVNETINVKIKIEKSSADLTKKNQLSILNNKLDCTNILTVQTYQMINQNCNILVDVLNIGKTKKFIWVIKVNKKNNFNNKVPNLMTTYLNQNDLITFNFDSTKNSSLILVFGDNFNKNINKWIYNLIRGKAILDRTLYRIKTMGYGFKKINFKQTILIEEN